MTTLTDQTVLITGANRGLGREFVEQFLTRGGGEGLRRRPQPRVDHH